MFEFELVVRIVIFALVDEFFILLNFGPGRLYLLFAIFDFLDIFFKDDAELLIILFELTHLIIAFSDESINFRCFFLYSFLLSF